MFTLADTAAPMVAPATDVEIIDTAGGPDKDASLSFCFSSPPDKDEEPADTEPRQVPTMVQTRQCLRLLRNEVECKGSDQGLMQCLVKVEQGLLAPATT
ncbi:hypothetical protein HPB52_000970 [Rhipicephalus sanguineus]|uniref:Uncharacterized protein n=1 Tax=Rhipicephalus sanguineus TaxID=34632 RepID=A0A9D4T6D9_RHISA|nr:hypothetical protein HPB52_000970 [Rhipicephalus sanguineus]